MNQNWSAGPSYDSPRSQNSKTATLLTQIHELQKQVIVAEAKLEESRSVRIVLSLRWVY